MIRLGLEPGYDHGRFGVWFLDLPGAFLWSRTEAEALARAPAALTAFREWLREHGETETGSETTLEVSERVPATVIDGYEVNAIFTTDRVTPTRAEIDRSLRWLGYGHADLERLMDGASPIAASVGPAVTSIARHIAGAEVWLASRLGSASRYELPLDPTDTKTLRSTEAWAREIVYSMFDRDPTIERIDRNGETWTLPKVCRRLVYHLSDHVDEIERVSRGSEGTKRHMIPRR